MKSRGERELGGEERENQMGNMLCSCGKEKQELVLQEREGTGRGWEPLPRSEGLAPAHRECSALISGHLGTDRCRGGERVDV